MDIEEIGMINEELAPTVSHPQFLSTQGLLQSASLRWHVLVDLPRSFTY